MEEGSGMIYTTKDFENNLDHSVDVKKVADEIEKIIKKDTSIAYDGYSLAIKGDTPLIRFYAKTDDGREYIDYDPTTLSYHIQNDLWFSGFDEDSIFRMMAIFSRIRMADLFRPMGGC